MSKIREKYLSRLIDGNDATSINMVCMNKLTFFNLCPILHAKRASKTYTTDDGRRAISNTLTYPRA